MKHTGAFYQNKKRETAYGVDFMELWEKRSGTKNSVSSSNEYGYAVKDIR
jgi:nitrous oxidase accessory protein NosD